MHYLFDDGIRNPSPVTTICHHKRIHHSFDDWIRQPPFATIVCHNKARPMMPNGNPWDAFLYPTFKLMIDSYKVAILSFDIDLSSYGQICTLSNLYKYSKYIFINIDKNLNIRKSQILLYK